MANEDQAASGPGFESKFDEDERKLNAWLPRFKSFERQMKVNAQRSCPDEDSAFSKLAQ